METLEFTVYVYSLQLLVYKMISSLKRCTTVAFIVARKQTRTRRWRKGKRHGQARDKAQTSDKQNNVGKVVKKEQTARPRLSEDSRTLEGREEHKGLRVWPEDRRTKENTGFASAARGQQDTKKHPDTGFRGAAKDCLGKKKQIQKNEEEEEDEEAAMEEGNGEELSNGREQWRGAKERRKGGGEVTGEDKREKGKGRRKRKKREGRASKHPRTPQG